MILYATFLMCAMLTNPYYANYISASDDYTIDIAASINPQRIDQPKGYVDVFQFVDTAGGKTGPGYMITILRTTPRNDFKFSSLMTNEFKQGYEDGCKCQVTGMDEVQYEKEKGVSYTMKYKKGKTVMAGYTATFQKGSYLYIINFSTAEASMNEYFPQYFHAVNTFDLHPSRMIVSGRARINSMAGK